MYLKQFISILICLFPLTFIVESQGQNTSDNEVIKEGLSDSDLKTTNKILELIEMGNYFKDRDLEDALHFYEQVVEISSRELRKSGANPKESVYGTSYIRSIRKIGELYHHWGEYEEAYKKYELLVDWLKNNDDQAFLDELYLHLANLKYHMTDYNSSLENYKLAEEFSRSTNNTDLIARSLQGIGSIYYLLGDYTSSMKYLQRAYKLADSLNYENIRINSIFTMGNLNVDMGNYADAEENYLECIEFYKDNDELTNLSNAYLSLGSLYYETGDYERAEREYLNSKETASQLRDNNLVSSALGNLGMVALEMGNPDKAENYYQQALEIARDRKDRESEMYILRNIARLRFTSGELERAQKFAFQSLDISHDIDHLQGQIWNNKLLADIHEETGNVSLALTYFKNFKFLSDSLMNQETKSTVSEMKIAFDTDNKEKQIKIQELQIDQKQTEIDRKNLILRFFSVIFALLIVLGLIFFYFARIRRKNRRELYRQEGLINDLQYKISGQAKQIEQRNTKINEMERSISVLEQNTNSGLALLQNAQKQLIANGEDFISLFKNNGYWFEWSNTSDNNTVSYARKKGGAVYLCLLQHTFEGVAAQIVNTMMLMQLDKYFEMDPVPSLQSVSSQIRKSLAHWNLSQEPTSDQKSDVMILKIQEEKIVFTADHVPLHIAISRPSKTAFDQNQVMEYHELQSVKKDISKNGIEKEKENHVEITELTLKSKDRIFLILACDTKEGQNKGDCLLHKEIVRLIDENQIMNFKRQRSLLEEGIKEFEIHQHPIKNHVMVVGVQI